MVEIQFVRVVVFVLITSLYVVDGKAILDQADENNVESHWTHLLGAVVSVIGLVCVIKLLAMCTELCQKKQIYKEFSDTDEVYNPDLNPSSPVAPEFSMYPPTENTPDTVVTTTPVVFEPLPDLTEIRPQPQVANAIQLRPKVAMVPQDHDDIDDLEDVIIAHDPSQDKMKLHNLLSNTRNQVPREQISYIKELGSGWFGKVLQGEGHNILPGHKKTKIVVQMLKEDANQQDQLAFLQEATPYREVDHRNVLKMLGQCVESAPYLTVLELCPFGDLKTYLRSHRVAMDSFNEKGLLLKFASDISAGLQALHEVHFVHRDFAARNCSLSSDLTVKIGDYGLAEDTFKEDYQFDKSGCGVPIRWLSPECILVQENGEVGLRYITKNCNVWSFGVTLWEIITFGNLPYGDLSNDLVLRLVIKEGSVRLSKPDVNITHLDRLYELMQLCWSAPSSRPSLRQLRIMLLHLLSNKMQSQNNDVFEEKWKKLLPRRAPQVVSAGTGGVVDGFANHNLSNGAIKTVSNNEIGAVPYSEPRGAATATQNQKANEDFMQLDVSKLNGENEEDDQAKSDIRDGLSLEEELALVHRKPENGGESFTTPINELSLAAELSGLQSNDNKTNDDDNNENVEEENKSEDTTPVNEGSTLEQELQASQKKGDYLLSDSVGSNLQDDIMILDNKGELVNSDTIEEDDIEITPPASSKPADTVVTPSVHSTPTIKLVEIATDTPGRSESIISSAGRNNPDSTTTTPTKDLSNTDFMSPLSEFDIITSTPKKFSDAEFQLPLSSQSGMTSDLQSAHSEYHTAFSTQMSTESTGSTPSASLTSTEDERSFLGQKKFAAILQTVVTSFDNEDDLTSQSFSEMSFEAIPEDDNEREQNVTPTAELVNDDAKENDHLNDEAKENDHLTEGAGGDNTMILDKSDATDKSGNDTSHIIAETSQSPLIESNQIQNGHT